MTRKKQPQTSKKSYADSVFNRSLVEVDEVARELADLEQTRQNNKLIMIASESLCPKPVRDALSTTFTNLYAEGYPRMKMILEERCALNDIDRQMVLHRRYQDRRYYKGCDYVNLLEALTQKRVAELFVTKNVSADHIYANVQSHSGASANNAIYEAFLKPGDTVMGLSLSSGGHLTHGSPSNRSGKHFKIVSYDVDLETGKLNYEKIREQALKAKPKMIIGGYSAYPWDVDWKKFREIADEVGDCIVLADVSHTAGLIVAGMLANPIEHAHVVMFTTQKTMCGPRGAVILTTDFDMARKIDSAVFPGEQSGAHFNNILAKAVCFEIAKTDAFKELQKQIVKNAQALAAALKRLGLDIAYGGTENHIVLINLRPLAKGGFALTGETASRVLDMCGITCNKNEITGDDDAVHPSGLRFGLTWVTQKGLKEEHMKRLAKIVNSVLTQIVPFEYIGGVKNIGRGKIRFDIIEKAKKEAFELVQEMSREGQELELDYPHFCSLRLTEAKQSPLYDMYKELGAKFTRNDGWTLPKEVSGHKKELKAVQKGSVILDTSDIQSFEVYGERSMDFLQESLSRNLYSMQEYDGIQTLMLSPGGNVMTSLNIFRLEDTKECGPKFLLTSSTEMPANIRDWLHALSDGYARFDPDVFMKVEGPVLVEDILRRSESWASFDLVGKKARKLMEKVAGRLPKKSSSWIKRVRMKGKRLQVFKLNENGKIDRYRLSGPVNVVTKAFDKLMSLDDGVAPVPGGILTRQSLGELAKIPKGKGREIAGAKVVKSKPELIDLDKPYFIGADLLETKEKVHKVIPPKLIEVGQRKSFLLNEHRRLFPIASIHSFAGWEMPIVFDSIRNEHETVRNAVGMFDLSHMGVFEISGPYSARFLDLITSNYVRMLRPGQSHYSYILDQLGDVLDDVFVYCIESDCYLIVANAINAEKIENWLNSVNDGKIALTLSGREVKLEGKVKIRNLKDTKSGKDRKMLIAVQGPKSRELLSEAVGNKGIELRRMKKFEIGKFSIKGAQCFISRTGYTGEEFGYEVFIHPNRVAKVWTHLLRLGLNYGIRPAGLGARDSTRAEAGLPLWGNELAGPDNITPIEAGYGAFVKLHKPFFIGRDAMVREMLNRNREVVRFKIEKKGARIARRDDMVATKEGEVIGKVTSNIVAGTTQVGLALIERGLVEEGDAMLIALSHTVGDIELETVKETGKLTTFIPTEESQVLPRFPLKENGKTIWH